MSIQVKEYEVDSPKKKKNVKEYEMDSSKFRDPMFFSLLSLSLVLKILVSLKKRVVRLNSFNENYCCYWYD